MLNELYMPVPKTCFPRQRIIKFKKKVEQREREQWDFHKSVFAEYQPDTQDIIDKIFEADWELISKPYAKSEDDLEKIKREMKKWYWLVRDAFKYYSSMSISSGAGTFALTLNSFTDFLKQAGLYKSGKVAFVETDTLFYSISKRDKPTLLNPGNSIIRYQFLEIIVKIGLKYSKKKDPGEAIKQFCEEIIENSLPQGKGQMFRNTRYWNLE